MRISLGPAVLRSHDIDAITSLIRSHAKAEPEIYVGPERKRLSGSDDLGAQRKRDLQYVAITTPDGDIELRFEPTKASVDVIGHPGAAHELAALTTRGFHLRPLLHSWWFVAMAVGAVLSIVSLFVSASNPRTLVSHGGAVAFSLLTVTVCLLIVAQMISTRGGGIMVRPSKE